MRKLTAALGALATLLFTVRVHATDCGSPFGFDALPGFMSEAPRNTRVWVLAYPSDSIDEHYQWRDASGAPVSFSVRRVPVAQLTPTCASARAIWRATSAATPSRRLWRSPS